MTFVEDYIARMATVDASTNLQASTLIDTNVAVEWYSPVDLLREIDQYPSAEEALRAPKVRFRLNRSRDSIVLAYHLAKRGATVGIHGAEVVKMLDSLVKKPDEGGDVNTWLFTTGIVHVVRTFVLRDLKVGGLTELDHRTKGTRADKEILREAKDHSMTLITWEGITEDGTNSDPSKLRNRAKAENVPVFSPTEYLASHNVDTRKEAWNFVFACTKGVREARRQRILANSDVLDYIVPLYRFILLDEVADNLAKAPRARASRQRNTHR